MTSTNFLWTAPDDKIATLAEKNGSLVNAALSELVNTPIYPSIHFESIEAMQAGFTMPEPEPQPLALLEPVNKYIEEAKKSVNEQRAKIEQTKYYKQAEALYNRFFKSPEYLIDHPLFKEQQQSENTPSIQCMSWHPHFNMLAVGHKDNRVYIYELQQDTWTCQVLAHPKMQQITCLEWKSKTSGILAVGCQSGVCIWNLKEKSESTSSTPRYHPHAFMENHIDQIDHISSVSWDPTPGSHLLAIVSIKSHQSALYIHDFLLERTTALKRVGSGNILVKWSPNGEFLFQGGSCGMSRIWDTSDWTCQQIKNPPGLWIQAACWSPADNRTLLYSMWGKSEIHALFLSGRSVNATILDVKMETLSATQANKSDQEETTVRVGGVIRDMAIDPRNGQRLAICFEGSSLIALYSVRKSNPLHIKENPMLLSIGYVRCVEVAKQNGAVTSMKSMTVENPLQIKFSSSYKDGAVMAVAWDHGVITFVTHTFLTDEEIRSRYM